MKLINPQPCTHSTFKENAKKNIRIENPLLEKNEIFSNISSPEMKNEFKIQQFLTPNMEILFKYQKFLHQSIMKNKKDNKSAIDYLESKLEKKNTKLNRYEHRAMLLDMQKQFLDEDIFTSKLLIAEINYKASLIDKLLKHIATFSKDQTLMNDLIYKKTQFRKQIYHFQKIKKQEIDQSKKLIFEKNIIEMLVKKRQIKLQIKKLISNIAQDNNIKDIQKKEFIVYSNKLIKNENCVTLLKKKLIKLENDIEGFNNRLNKDILDNENKLLKQQQKCEILKKKIEEVKSQHKDLIGLLEEEKQKCYSDIRTEKK